MAKQACALHFSAPVKKSKFENSLCSAAAFVRLTNLRHYTEKTHLVLKHGDELHGPNGLVLLGVPDIHFHYNLLQTLEKGIVLDDVIAFFLCTVTSFVPETLSAVNLETGICQHYHTHK